jgi:membrane-bound lytic murein transglycosylase D
MNKKKMFFLYGFISGAFLLFLLGLTVNNVKDGNNFPQGYRIISPPVPNELYFCGERIPMENFEVYERVDRELIVNTYFHSATILAMKRANRWFPVVEPILEANGTPDDMKYLMIAESGITNAVSPAGATGYWQFMEKAALKYGLEVNSEVDERYNMEKATEAACRYLNEADSLFGSWTMAAASYNTGIENVQKQIERQKAKNYYNLVFSEETLRYITRAVAIKEIMNNPERYGFDIRQDELYNPLPYKLVQVNGPVDDLADFAFGYGINYRILKLYNPWLRDNVLTNKDKKVYSIKIPEPGSIKVIEE